jgi:hypothetical protein
VTIQPFSTVVRFDKAIATVIEHIASFVTIPPSVSNLIRNEELLERCWRQLSAALDLSPSAARAARFARPQVLRAARCSAVENMSPPPSA